MLLSWATLYNRAATGGDQKLALAVLQLIEKYQDKKWAAKIIKVIVELVSQHEKSSDFKSLKLLNRYLLDLEFLLEEEDPSEEDFVIFSNFSKDLERLREVINYVAQI